MIRNLLLVFLFSLSHESILFDPARRTRLQGQNCDSTFSDGASVEVRCARVLSLACRRIICLSFTRPVAISGFVGPLKSVFSELGMEWTEHPTRLFDILGIGQTTHSEFFRLVDGEGNCAALDAWPAREMKSLFCSKELIFLVRSLHVSVQANVKCLMWCCFDS